MSINPFVFFLYRIHQFPFFPGWWLMYSIGLLRFLWNPFSLHWTSSLVGKVLGSCLIPQPPFTVLEPWSKITCKLFWHCQIPYFSKWLIFSHMQNIMRQFFLNCRAKNFISLFCAFISQRGLFLWNQHCLEQMLLSFRRKIMIILSLILPQEMNCRSCTVFFHNSIGLQKGNRTCLFFPTISVNRELWLLYLLLCRLRNITYHIWSLIRATVEDSIACTFHDAITLYDRNANCHLLSLQSDKVIDIIYVFISYWIFWHLCFQCIFL